MVHPIRFHSNNSKDNTGTAGKSLLLSTNFRSFQILTDILRYSQVGLLSKFKPINVGF